MKTEPAKQEWMESVNGTELQVEEIGAGAGTVVFSPSLYTNRKLFEPTMAALSGDHRCIAYDHRGQGDSGFGIPQPSTHLMGVEGLYDDAVALLDRLSVDSCHWVGVSLGAFVGIRLAARHPERVRSLVLVGVATRPVTRAERLQIDLSGWLLRASNWLGPVGGALRRRITEQVMRGMFGPSFMSDPARAADRDVWRPRFAAQMVPEVVPVLHAVFRHQGNPPDLLAQVKAPTLVVVGEEEYGGDTSAREAQQAIPNALLVTIPRAGHSVLAEQPDLGTQAIAEFIREVEAT